MAKKASKKQRCCMCPTTAARATFRAAKTQAVRSGSCSPLQRAYDDLKRAAGDEYAMLPKGQRALLAREMLQKQNEVHSTCARIEAQESSRFNGLFGLGLFGIL